MMAPPNPVQKPAWSAAVAVMLVLSAVGCTTVGPDYEQPQQATPDAWHNAAIEGLDTGDAALQVWWQVFDDPQLERLITRTETANLSLREALWRVEEARALRGVVDSRRRPQVDVTGSSSVQQQSDNGPIPPPEGGFESAELHDLGVGAGWEIDLFGRIRRSVEAADAEVQASVEQYRDVLVSLFGEVAVAYVDVRSLQERLRLARANVTGQSETLELTEDRFQAGLVSALDVAQAESNLANTESLIPTLELLLEASLNRLAVLAGETPGSLHDELSQNAPVPQEPTAITAGLPADLLRQRPDIRRSERQLAAQTARIGIATAELYPSLSLGGFLGLQATNVGDLFSSDSVNWSVGLPIRWSIFSGGRIHSQIRAEEARTEQAVARYEQTVLLALEEVENALSAYSLETDRRTQLTRAVDATERSLQLVLTQYRSGIADFQNVLDTQRTLLLRQDELAVSQGQVIVNLVRLYTALGGGWDPASTPVPRPAQTQGSAVAGKDSPGSSEG